MSAKMSAVEVSLSSNKKMAGTEDARQKDKSR
jgi:hypothetical protein